MNESLPEQPSTPPARASQRYLWPKLLLSAVLLGAVIAVLFVLKEAQRMRQIRDPMHSPTNYPAPPTP